MPDSFIHSFNRRCKGHDYHSRCIYMITIIKSPSFPVFSTITHDSKYKKITPIVNLTRTGKIIYDCLDALCMNFPSLKILRRIAMPDHIHFEPELTKISRRTFSHCSGLTRVSFPQSIEIIEYSAFYNCTGLTGDLILPENLKTIGYGTWTSYGGAFENCTGLNGKLILPEGLTHIGYHTFYNCSGLSGELKIPDSVKNINISAFNNCSNFTGELKIPATVSFIGEGAFANCTGLTGEPILPNALTAIEDKVFLNCSGLKGNIILPPNIESIGNESFAGCLRLTGPVTSPASVRSIGSHSFKDTRITEVVFEPNSVISTLKNHHLPHR